MQKVIIAVVIIVLSSLTTHAEGPFFTPITITATCLSANAVMFCGLSAGYFIAGICENSSNSILYITAGQIALIPAAMLTMVSIPCWGISIVQHNSNKVNVRISPNYVRLVMEF
jgi:hypothetical protein